MVLLFLVALVGHTFLWVTTINRLHGSRVEGRWRDAVTVLAFACLVLIPVGYALGLARWDWRLTGPEGLAMPWPATAYLGLSCVGAAVAVVGWGRHHVLHQPPDGLRYHRTRVIDVAEPARPAVADDKHHFLVRLPGNEILQLDLAERGIDVPRLPKALDRLSIVHLSDFHFTGRIGKSYFQEVVRLTNELNPDLILITGDLVDRPAYIDWVPETFGRLTSRFGTYFVLGNHDLQVDHRRLRQVLTDSGLVDLGGRWCEVEIRGERLLLAGNELPWFKPAADLAQLPMPAEGGSLRIALAHSPDQLRWAQAHGIDLLLAGHTHGGQIRIPLIGPIFSPCRHGVKYAWGLYDAPPTLLHVTRGVSGQFPVRMNCPPELVHLVLRVPWQQSDPQDAGSPAVLR
jgi:predicted MPP superfamily phosphohydrolase